LLRIIADQAIGIDGILLHDPCYPSQSNQDQPGNPSETQKIINKSRANWTPPHGSHGSHGLMAHMAPAMAARNPVPVPTLRGRSSQLSGKGGQCSVDFGPGDETLQNPKHYPNQAELTKSTKKILAFHKPK